MEISPNLHNVVLSNQTAENVIRFEYFGCQLSIVNCMFVVFSPVYYLCFAPDNTVMVSVVSLDVDHYLCPPLVHLYFSRHGLARPVWHPVNTALQTLCENPYLNLIGPC